jgi:hypothetical protein
MTNKPMMKCMIACLLTLVLGLQAQTQEKVFPGADEKSPSRAQYYTWINNTNEGPTEEQTLVNLKFFEWLKKEYGMQLDIYAFDAGAIDGKNFYGSIYSDRFKKQFPQGLDPVYKKAKSVGIRLGVWGGPDGFGDSPKEAQARIDQMVKLCRDYEFELFKFDAVCGPLRPDKEDFFIEMMQNCRKYSPDLILLNHRLGLQKGKPYATTSLMGGDETYIDVHMTNSMTAPHHRAQALSRELSPSLKRLIEDCGVCISSCLDYWDDDLILQAFNRSMILAPEIFGNPWLLRDDEYPKLARIYNLHKKYGNILVNGIVLPDSYGPNAVSRGDDQTRIITLRNLSWTDTVYTLKLDEETGLHPKGTITLVQIHPTEKIIGTFKKGDAVNVAVQPFRSCMLIATTRNYDEPAIIGTDYNVVKDIPSSPVEMEILGMPGTKKEISLSNPSRYQEALIDGRKIPALIKGKKLQLSFPGTALRHAVNRKLGDLAEIPVPDDAVSLYEATVFAADNNALEVRSLQRSGETSIPEVKAARDAFFNQKAFVDRGVWDKNLFDADPKTGYWQTSRYRHDRGCLRIDLGKVQHVDELIVTVPDMFSLLPLMPEEGNFVEISSDLINWERITYLADLKMKISIGKATRYLRFRSFPQRITEIEGVAGGKMLDRSNWRASNLFEYPTTKKAQKAWKTTVVLDEIPEGSYLCVALEGKLGIDGAYAAAKIDGKLVGSPDRAPSFFCNPWETFNARKDENYTYYIPLKPEYKGKNIEVYALGFDPENLNFKPVLWISANPYPFEKMKLTLIRKNE